MNDAKTTIAESADKFNKITPSVLAIARALGVTPVKFAEAVYANELNDEYLSEVSAAGIKIAVKMAKDAKTKHE